MMIDDDDDEGGGGAAAYRPVHVVPVHVPVREEKMGIIPTLGIPTMVRRIAKNWQETPAKRAFISIFLAKYWQETDFSKKSLWATPSEKLEIRSYMYLFFAKIWLFFAPTSYR